MWINVFHHHNNHMNLVIINTSQFCIWGNWGRGYFALRFIFTWGGMSFFYMSGKQCGTVTKPWTLKVWECNSVVTQHPQGLEFESSTKEYKNRRELWSQAYQSSNASLIIDRLYGCGQVCELSLATSTSAQHHLLSQEIWEQFSLREGVSQGHGYLRAPLGN